MDTIQETSTTPVDLQVTATAAAQDLALINHDGMTPSPRSERQLLLPEQATPQEVADVMDGVLGKPEAEPAPLKRWQDFKDGKVDTTTEALPKHSMSLISYIGRQAVRVFKRQ